MQYSDLKKPKELPDFHTISGKWVLTWPFGTHASVECWRRAQHPDMYESKEAAIAARTEESLEPMQISENYPMVMV